MSARPILLLFKFRAIILILLAIGALNTGSLQAVEPDWSTYNAILRQNVRPGQISGIPLNRVNYAGIKANPGWSNVVAMIAAFPVSKLSNRSEKLAFYINAYNILTIDLIIKGGIPASIRNLGESVWKQNNVRLDGRLTSLDAIEHQLLRPLGEPRIHFA
ncbi:MAG: DUF547 domain-containing protein, partial [Leptospiraceae bacterium]|nr:DUF547 domain-containing protein [Leptospiraceae bacterium]